MCSTDPDVGGSWSQKPTLLVLSSGLGWYFCPPLWPLLHHHWKNKLWFSLNFKMPILPEDWQQLLQRNWLVLQCSREEQLLDIKKRIISRFVFLPGADQEIPMLVPVFLSSLFSFCGFSLLGSFLVNSCVASDTCSKWLSNVDHVTVSQVWDLKGTVLSCQTSKVIFWQNIMFHRGTQRTIFTQKDQANTHTAFRLAPHTHAQGWLTDQLHNSLVTMHSGITHKHICFGGEHVELNSSILLLLTVIFINCTVEVTSQNEKLYAVRAIKSVPGHSCHFSCMPIHRNRLWALFASGNENVYKAKHCKKHWH